MAIYRGLNVQLNLADVDDKDASLESLGLNIDDFEIIRGLSDGGVSSLDLRTISGLDVDQKKELYAMSRTSATIGNLLRDMKDIAIPLEFNMQINDQLRAGAIKYDYIDWTNPTSTKSADISTSRISSWSSTDSPATSTSDIFYGGEVRVVGNTVEADNIQVQTAPTLARYPAEVPTHTIEIDINGVTKEVHAMKGIPLTYEGFFRNANLRGRVNKIGSINPTWTVRNTDNNRFYETYTPFDENDPRAGGTSIIGENSTWYFRDSQSHPRELSFYYNPNNITELDLHSLNLNSLPNVSLPNLTHYYLYFNDFYEVPRFDQIAPALRYIHMQGNNLSRTGVTAHDQLQRFSNSIETMIFHGCFTDSTTIDVSNYTNLTYFGLNSHYSRYGVRRMTDSGVSPHVNSSSIVDYSVTYQPYSRLSKSLCDSTTLSRIWIYGCNISAAQDTNGTDFDVTVASSNLREFNSYSNNHNIVKLNGPSINSVQRYYHTHSNPVGGVSPDSVASTVSGKFTGCTSLSYINLYGNACTGNIGTDFANLPALDWLEVRWSRLSGNLTDNSFLGSDNLRGFLMAGSWYNSSNFFSSNLDAGGNLVERGKVFDNALNLQYFYLYSNRSISGALPNFSRNINLRVLYLTNTNINGFITNFSSNKRLYYMNLSNNQFTGGVPSFNGSQFYYIYLNSNQLEGQLPLLQCSNLRRFYVHYNKDLNGSVPTFEFCPRLQYAYFYNNNLSGWATGTMDKNTWLRRLDISNNRLSVGAVRNIISDMMLNYQNNARSNVTVNLLGQTDFNGNPVTEADVVADEATFDNLKFLRTVGWTILI